MQTQLLVELGFFTSAAVLVVGVTTAVLLDGDFQSAAVPLLALWGGSTVVFALFAAHIVNRLVLSPLRRLAADADDLADGAVPGPGRRYESVEFDWLAERYRGMATELLDVQSHIVRVEKLAGIGRLAAGVAHEVRNPLGALNTYVEVLRRRGAAPDVTAEMRQAVERIDGTVQELLNYARPDRVTGPCDLNAAVRTAVDFLTSQGALRDHDVTVELAPDAVPVHAGRHALEQVVTNLVINAAQATGRGRVTVGTTVRPYERRRHAGARASDRVSDRVSDREVPAPAGRRAAASRPRRPDLAPGTMGVLLYVADDGPGVPAADRDRIFDPFFTTKDPGEGVGLGLAIVARTVHEAGGVVWVDPAREHGAVFKVFFPLAAGNQCAC